MRNDSADYIDGVAWNKLAETNSTSLKKGMRVLVEGQWRLGLYSLRVAKDTSTEVVATFMQMLNSNQLERQSAGDLDECAQVESPHSLI